MRAGLLIVTVLCTAVFVLKCDSEPRSWNCFLCTGDCEELPDAYKTNEPGNVVWYDNQRSVKVMNNIGFYSQVDSDSSATGRCFDLMVRTDVGESCTCREIDAQYN